jgi:beta-lactamase superfamily II metal-dependent hydrolase
MFEMVVWDVQHGNAVYIRTPSNSHIVQDLGTGTLHGTQTSTFSPLLHLKHNYHVQQLDYAIITHPHRDHISDILNFDSLSPRVLSRPNHLSEHDIRQGSPVGSDRYVEKYIEIDRRYSGPVPSATNPMQSTNNGGVAIETYVPYLCNRGNLNNHSVVTIISYMGHKIMLPGDNEPPSWDELLTRQDFRQAIDGVDILLAPHHGRQSAFYSGIFNFFRPQLTIISDGPCDTSAVNEYRRFTDGCLVHNRRGGIENRQCVTTRRDGVIDVRLKDTWNSPVEVWIN